MSYKAIYAYAWDLAEVGVASAAARFRALGLDTVTIAGSYHAGKFLRPHGRTGKVYFPEDGTVYFRPTERLYGAIKPAASRIARERDVLRELCDAGAISVNVWLVLLHNTKLGEANPESCVMNAFGDRYVYNLCPAAPEARAYALGLCQDVTTNCARRVGGDAGLSPLCARLPSRVRADQMEPVARKSARPLFLRALREGRGASRHRCRRARQARAR
jgi:hypothetical protein